jgi:hypothetical protein
MPDRPYVKLDLPRRRTIATASRLIYDAGWRDKARFLDDWLERGRIFLDPNLQPPKSGRGAEEKIHLGEGLELTKNNPPAPLDRKDQELVLLAALLVNLADQAMGRSRLDGLGDALAFGRKVRTDTAELFPDTTEAERARLGRTGQAIEEHAQRQRDEAAKNAPPKPPPENQNLKAEFHLNLPEPGIAFTSPIELIGFRTQFPESTEGDEPAGITESERSVISGYDARKS